MNEQQHQTQKVELRPQTPIDLQASSIKPYLSSDFVSDRIRNKFREFAYLRNEKGEIIKDEQGSPVVQITNDIWATIELFTQDMRLGNLKHSELTYVRYNIDLCSDILTVLPDTFNKPAFLLLERTTSVLESSNSRNGFLRTLMNTLFQNQTIKEDKPEKRGFFGLGKKNGSD